MQKFVGTGVALVTPFKKDLSIDFTALSKLVEFNIVNGVDYLVINGTTGESVTVSREERKSSAVADAAAAPLLAFATEGADVEAKARREEGGRGQGGARSHQGIRGQ